MLLHYARKKLADGWIVRNKGGKRVAEIKPTQHSLYRAHFAYSAQLLEIALVNDFANKRSAELLQRIPLFALSR